MRTHFRDAAWCLTSGALGAILVGFGPALIEGTDLGAAIRAPLSFGDVERLAGLVAVALGLLILCWWAIGLLAAFAACLLALSGRPKAARRAARLSPVFMCRLSAALLGANLLVAPAAHAAAIPAAADAAFAATAPIPYWSAGEPGMDPVREAPAESELAMRTNAPNPGWQAEKPAAPMDRLLGGGGREGTGRDVVVKRGDSLWSIAAQSLGAQATEAEIAREWPRWYGANRQSIGADPNHLDVGTILVPPTR